MSSVRYVWVLSLYLILSTAVAGWAAVGGSISGTVKDATGAVIPGAMITVTNVALRAEFKVTSDSRGYYSFPSLAVGRYDLSIEAPGFKAQKKSGIVVDVDSAVEVSMTLAIAEVTQEISVSATPEAEQVQVETVSTQLGDVVTG